MLVNKKIMKPWLWTMGFVSLLALGRMLPESIWIAIQLFVALYTIALTFLYIVSSLLDNDSYGYIDNIDKE